MAQKSPVLEPPVVLPKKKERPAKPPMYAILVHNDGTTYPDFVVHVLTEAFSVNANRSTELVDAAHRTGKAVVKITTLELAETQVHVAQNMVQNADINCFAAHLVSHCELQFTIEQESKGD